VSDWLSPAVEYIASWIELQRRHLDLPGIAIAIRDHAGIRLDAAFGVADLATGARLTPRHRFRVASHSKTFTAVAILKLKEAGRLRLDDPVGQYVDGLAPRIGEATIAQLLSHTAGICRDGSDAAQWSDRGPFLDEAALRRDLAAAPVIDADTRMKYSNHGYGLLGLVIEQVTGEPYRRWMSREVIAAAGLAHTYPDVPVPPRVPFSRGHTGKLLLGERLVIPGNNPTHALASATGFVSTAADLTRFFLQLAPTAKDSLLGVASRRELTRRLWRVPDASLQQHYGFGLVHGDMGAWSWFGHSGGFQGYLTQTVVLPSQQVAVSVLTNALDGVPALLVEGCLRILQAFAKHGPPRQPLADWRGRWWGLWGAVDLVPMGNIVVVAAPALANPLLDATELTPTGEDSARITRAGGFASYGELARLVRNRRDVVIEVRLAATRLRRAAALAREMRQRYARREP
jgi:D-alanyl-D-alanine carboxypeptidase